MQRLAAFAAVLLAGLFWLAGPASAAATLESLHYRASYQGLFSAGARVRIADVELHLRRPDAGAPYLESELLASSAAYGAVEAIHPIRYRLRSWFWPDRSGVLAAEYHEFGRPDDLEHKLFFLDDPEQAFVAHDLRKEGEGLLQRLRRGRYLARVGMGQRRAFDRLGLVQAVRARALAPGDRFEVPVSNGEKMLRYRVRVEKAETLQLGGRRWPALKLRFDGLEQDERGRWKHAHRPVFLWLSRDDRHLPLLAEARAAVGRFRIELVEAPGTQVALR